MITWDMIVEWLLPVVKTLIIVLIGHLMVRYILRLMNRGLNRSKLDPSLIRFSGKAANIVLHIIIAISALNAMNVSTSGIVAALSAAAVAVSLALKDSLGNVAGGILLLLSPRFVTGDYIASASDEGTVLSVDLLHTTILTLDNKQVSIPNGVLINSHIINFSRENRRRVDIVFPISYDADVEKAKSTAIRVMEAHPLILNEKEEYFVRVQGYADSAVNLLVRAWCGTKDYWDVYFDLTEQIREAFRAEGVDIPYNQLDVHILNR